MKKPIKRFFHLLSLVSMATEFGTFRRQIFWFDTAGLNRVLTFMLRYINVEFTITATCTPCEYLTSRGKTKWCQLKKESTELADIQNIVWKTPELDMRHVSNRGLHVHVFVNVLGLQPDSLRARDPLRLHVHIISVLWHNQRVLIHFRGTLNKSFMNKRLNSHGWVQEKSRLSNPWMQSRHTYENEILILKLQNLIHRLSSVKHCSNERYLKRMQSVGYGPALGAVSFEAVVGFRTSSRGFLLVTRSMRFLSRQL